MKSLNVLLFEDFTALDALGPVEVFGRLPEDYSINFYSANGSDLRTKTNIRLKTEPISEIQPGGILLVPGGMGTRSLVHDASFIAKLREVGEASEFVLSVCTGSALVAKAGLLDNRRATSNKRAFSWVTEQSDSVAWVKRARWVVDGKFYSSSGVSAGIDMALGFIADQHSRAIAEDIANALEYRWQTDPNVDEFADGPAAPADFWKNLEELIADKGITIDRLKGSRHPRFPDLIYQVDYGYINDTRSMDMQGIDVFRGSLNSSSVIGVFCTLDSLKHDSEIKVVLDCTEEEIKTLVHQLNTSLYMRAVLIRR